MFDFHEKRKIRAVLYSKPVFGILLIATIALSTSVYDRYVVARDMEAKLIEKQKELERIEERSKVLEEKVTYLKNDRGVEEEIRNRFDVAREGEKVVIILDGEDEQATSAEMATEVEVPDEGFFTKMLFWR